MGRRSSVAVALLAALYCFAACGEASPGASIVPAPSAPPARELLGRVAIPKDFQITYRTHYLAAGPLRANSNPYVERLWSGSGEIILQPKLIASLHETNTFCADLCPVDEIVDGTDRYTRAPQSSWGLDHEIGLDNYYWSAILPSTLRQATAVRVAGQQRLDGHQTWVVDAQMPDGQPFRVWLRQDDGYPVRLTSSPNAKTPYMDIEIDAAKFDSGIVISDPPRNQLFPLYWGTEYHREQPIPLDGGSVTIQVSVYNCHGGGELDDSLDSGFFVLIPFTYQAAAKPLAIDPGEWHIYDAFGHPYQAQPLETAPLLVAESVPPGESRSGDMCFFLPWNQDGLALVGDLPGGFVTSFVGGVSLPASSGQASPAGR
jgi:hypothetical protein